MCNALAATVIQCDTSHGFKWQICWLWLKLKGLQSVHLLLREGINKCLGWFGGTILWHLWSMLAWWQVCIILQGFVFTVQKGCLALTLLSLAPLVSCPSYGVQQQTGSWQDDAFHPWKSFPPPMHECVSLGVCLEVMTWLFILPSHGLQSDYCTCMQLLAV